MPRTYILASEIPSRDAPGGSSAREFFYLARLGEVVLSNWHSGSASIGPIRANERRRTAYETKHLPIATGLLFTKEARKTAESEGISLNQLINLAVAEKISALRTEEFSRERGARANVKKARKILMCAGKEAPREGDGIPFDLQTTCRR